MKKNIYPLQTSTQNQFVVVMGIVITHILLSVDAIGSMTTIYRNIGISSWVLFLLFFTILLFTKKKWTLSSQVVSTLKWIAVLFFSLSSFLILFKYFTIDNFVYTLTRIQPSQLLVISHTLIATALLSRNIVWWKRWGRKLVQLLPFWILLVSLLVRLLPFDMYIPYATEDGVMEYIQVAILLFSVITCMLQIGRSLRTKKIPTLFVYVVLALGSFFIMMEEISWGQRLFGWSTPDALAEVNVQNETTLHNIGIFNDFQLVAYIGICALGSFVSVIQPKYQTRVAQWVWNPPKISFWFFAIPCIFYLYFVLYSKQYHLWLEIMEVLFYAGIALWILRKATVMRTYIRHYLS